MNYFGKGKKEEIFTRSSCHGYKVLKIAEEVEMASPLEFVTENENELVLRVAEESDDNAEYTFICDEFGLYDYKNKGGMSAKVSVIFCDDGKMLVTLHQGTLILNYEDNLIQPVVGVEDCPRVVADDIYWVNADILLSNKAYFGDTIRQVHTQDFEYMFTLSGGKTNGCSSFKLKCHRDEYIDLSLGHVAIMEEEEKKKEEAKRAKQMLKMSVPVMETSSGLDLDDVFDDDEEEEDDFFEYED